MAIQTTYGTPESAFAGMLSDISPADVRTGINEESSSIPWGIAVKVGTVGTSNDYVGLPTAADDIIAGFLIHDHAHDNRASASGSDEALAADKAGSILRRGYFYAQPEVTVARGDPVFFRIATSGGKTQKGALGNVDDSGTAVRMEGARWMEAATSSQFAMIEVLDVNQPGHVVLGRSLANGSTTADTTTFYMETSADRHFLIEEVVYYNATGLAADAANFFNIKLQDATPTVYANWSTETGEEGAIAADTPVRLTLGASVIVPPDSRLNVFYDETGSATLPAGEIQVLGRYL